MAKEKKYTHHSPRVRIIGLAFFILFLCGAAGIRLMQFQVVKGADLYEEAMTTTISTYTVQASRGDITDRYGRKLATSEIGYNVVFDWAFVDRTELNKTIHTMIEIFKNENVQWVNELPILYNGGNYVIESGKEDEADAMKKLIKVQLYASEKDCVDRMMSRYEINDYPILEKEGKYKFDEDREDDVEDLKDELKLPSNATAEECMEKIKANPDEFPIYSQEDAFEIAAVRYTMEKMEFSFSNRYTFAENIPIDLVMKIKEMSYLFDGVDIEEKATRVYKNEDVASHILGDVGLIQDYSKYKDKGYPMNAIVGNSGIEETMEDVLRGEDGQVRLTQNAKGDVISTDVVKEAVAGDTVQLTIDYEFQKRLQKIIGDFIESGSYTPSTRPAQGGSIVVLDVKSGEVLGAATYPNYSIDQLKNDYHTLEENPLRPMYNRALYGTYRPGSSFKPVVGVAALSEGVLSSGTETVYCGRVYQHWDQFKPICQGSHGNINVMNALRVSCNIFFYEMGVRLGIDKVHEYGEKMGLEGKTGIEIGEATSRVASKERTEELGGIWYEGDIAQASIGQNNTSVTPIAMACEAMAIANKGTVYETHVIDAVLDYEGNLKKEIQPKVRSSFDMPDSVYDPIKTGMIYAGQRITGQYSLSGLGYEVAVKTGTPQTDSTGKRMNNDFIAFTINGEDSIAISCMIEDVGSGASTLIRQIIDAYEECKELGKMETTPQYPQNLSEILS